VLFCGGLGTRLRDQSGGLPKPMVNIGQRPILWHIMKYYAHYGHKDFILCLGYLGSAIKNFFLNYDQALSSDFALSNGQRKIHANESDISDWNITFIDTGVRRNIGQRLQAVEKYLEGDEYFLANYADGLTDLPLPELIGSFQKSGKVGCFLSVKPSQTFHVVSLNDDGLVKKIENVRDTSIMINGGYFVFRKEIFQYMKEGEELVAEPFSRLIAANQLLAYPYEKFWYCMDTFKEERELNEMLERGDAPWEVWKR
jgi:glucose-1-phosphate cytidylyltransferase